MTWLAVLALSLTSALGLADNNTLGARGSHLTLNRHYSTASPSSANDAAAGLLGSSSSGEKESGSSKFCNKEAERLISVASFEARAVAYELMAVTSSLFLQTIVCSKMQLPS